MYLLTFAIGLCFFLLHQPAASLDCFPWRGPRTTTTECIRLIAALSTASQVPIENRYKTWGRNVEDGPDTAKLPKVYTIRGSPDNTCSVLVDVRFELIEETDDFRLSNVVLSAQRVVAGCFPVGKTGQAYPGPKGYVWARIIRRLGIVTGGFDIVELDPPANGTFTIEQPDTNTTDTIDPIPVE